MEKIKLTFPSNPKYLQTLRLATASIANNEGFDIDTIEDIKVIVSELFTFLVTENDEIKIKFLIDEENFEIIFKKDKINEYQNLSDANLELKKQILLALCDDIVIDDKKITVIVNK